MLLLLFFFLLDLSNIRTQFLLISTICIIKKYDIKDQLRFKDDALGECQWRLSKWTDKKLMVATLANQSQLLFSGSHSLGSQNFN